MTLAPASPAMRLSLALTGHREGNAAFAANRAAIVTQLDSIFRQIAAAAIDSVDQLGMLAPIRLHSLLADGTDQVGLVLGEQLGWELVAPLPAGRELNLVINAQPTNAEDARALLEGRAPDDPKSAAAAGAIRHWYGRCRIFELADCDEAIAVQFLASLEDAANREAAHRFSATVSAQVALAGRIMIEQSDFMIAVWDGRSANLIGGTGHTISAALDRGCPVLRIDPANPEAWHILHAPESLAALPLNEDRKAALDDLVRRAIRPGEGGALRNGAESLAAEAWHEHSSRLWTGYRRIEAMFGGDGKPFRSLVTRYESPGEIAAGSGRAVLAAAADLPGGDADFPPSIEAEVMRRFAWADGISARLSDAYRGGMTLSFVFSVMAIISGISYEPFAGPQYKWLFATGEFLLLAAILGIIWLGGRERWHKRWFETRRVAEYFRHAPILLLLGVARPAGRWPKGTDTSWPEYYARHALSGLGLPRVAVTREYLRHAASNLLDKHVTAQRDYHRVKAKRLNTVHHRLDKVSERLFQAAFVSVSLYLVCAASGAGGLIPSEFVSKMGKYTSFFGVVFPTLGAGLAGIRYFGDFERFAAISEVTAEKLDGVHNRIDLLLSAPDHALSYAQLSELAHAADDIVVGEIENWQAVFGGKHITVPV
ncbi:MAG: hypothetical protein ACKOPM_09705 [Novosphingobium sp.]